MKLKSLSLFNYRQFFDENILNFSTDKDKKITVIHGENGAGKTSILNAFKWCFYGEVDFDTGTESLLNEQSEAEAKENEEVQCSVTVKFIHEDVTYNANRKQLYKKYSKNSIEKIGFSIFTLEWIDSDSGERKVSNNPENYINQVLPKSLHSYFFFNGERIEKLANSSSAGDIKHAIKSIMGLQVIERGKEHIDDYVIKNFKKEMKSHASQSELAKALEQEESFTKDLKDKKLELKNFHKTQKELVLAIGDIDNKLADIKESAQLQQRRNEINERISNIREELETNKTSLSYEISKKGFLAFFNRTADKVQNILDDKRAKGELPYKIRGQFIDDLLHDGYCICGTDISNETEAASILRRYKSKASSKSMEDSFVELSGGLKHITPQRQSLFEALKNLQTTRKKLIEERHKLLGELDTISNDVGIIEEASELEEKRKELESQKDLITENIGHLKETIKKITENLKEAEKLRKKLSESEQEKTVIKKRVSIAEESSVILGKLFDTLSETIKTKLSVRVNEVFKKIIRKDYWAEIDDHYALQIFKDIPGRGKQIVTEKSTGESQITSLAFISCIVNLAKENEEKANGLAQGGIFPIVMDSPFGTLDDGYRSLIARYIPELAEQIIVFVSSSQWKGSVQQEFIDSVSVHNSLVYYDPKLEGKETDIVKRSDTYERTEICEGYYDR
ncbi:MAG: hypothetical protein COB35_13055 [Gammaproteobacteria bacterium]|nr:MAG: hypothetical protein COB35_13055 [Gammaproteobacteria bacterium]